MAEPNVELLVEQAFEALREGTRFALWRLPINWPPWPRGIPWFG